MVLWLGTIFPIHNTEAVKCEIKVMDARCDQWCKAQSDMFDYGQYDERRERCACIVEVLIPEIQRKKVRLPMRFTPPQRDESLIDRIIESKY